MLHYSLSNFVHSAPAFERNTHGEMGFFEKHLLKISDKKRMRAAELTLRVSIYPLCLVTILFFLWKQYRLFHAPFIQFRYTGAQIAIAGAFINYITETSPKTDPSLGAQFLAGAQGAFALGRFAGSALMKFVRPRSCGSGFIVGGGSGGAVVPPILFAAADSMNSTAEGIRVPSVLFVAAWTYAFCVNFVPEYRDVVDSFAMTKIGVESGRIDGEAQVSGGLSAEERVKTPSVHTGWVGGEKKV
ncbi:hypothetical protein P154DRAFT_536122 [Amniculicola lignicola CBS 123094]|uniref:MFS general substrate transporter n=1 Tax=Amniculicola lignicola CBS 123094 TaxID=1392246 RepID=A0A6A5WI24_9PLEO|nr:hypothetical protein P154DRAFT_536122 [Amniculicola lignicola CBS 123094]